MADETVLEQPQVVTVDQHSPDAGELSVEQFREVRRGKSVEIPKPAEPGKQSGEPEQKLDTEETPEKQGEVKSGEEKQEVEPQNRPRKDPKKRIERLTREVYEKDDEIERLRRENDDLKKKVPVEKAAKPVDEDPEPVETEIDASGKEVTANNPKTGKPWANWREFSKAHAQWSYRQAQKEGAVQSEQQSRETQARESFTAHQTRTATFREAHDDFDEVCSTLATADVSEAVSQTLTVAFIESEDGPELMYHLGSHPELLKEFSKLTPLQAVRKLDRIAASLHGAPDNKQDPKPAKSESKAPAPITPVGANSSKPVNFSEDMSIEDWEKARKERRI